MKELKNNIVQNNAQLFAQYKEVVTKIAQIRKQSRTSQDATAQLIGVSRRTIIEFDKCEAYNWTVLVALCDRFGVTLDLFYTVE